MYTVVDTLEYLVLNQEHRIALALKKNLTDLGKMRLLWAMVIPGGKFFRGNTVKGGQGFHGRRWWRRTRGWGNVKKEKG